MNTRFEILKKGFDVSRDLLQSSPNWLKKCSYYLPIVGLSLALSSFALKTLIIMFNPKSDRTTKIAAGLLFVTLTMLAISAFLISANSPIIATEIMLGVSILNLIADGLSYLSKSNVYHRDKSTLKALEKSEAAANIELEKLIKKQMHLSTSLVFEMKGLIEASKRGDVAAYQMAHGRTNKLLSELTLLDYEIQSLQFPKQSLQKKLQQQSRSLNLSLISMAISTLSITSITFCLVSSGAMPVGVSIFLSITFVLDMCELLKNIYAKHVDAKNETNHKLELLQRRQHIKEQATEKLETNHDADSSYLRLLKTMDFKKAPTSIEKPTPQKTKSSDIPPVIRTGAETLPPLAELRI